MNVGEGGIMANYRCLADLLFSLSSSSECEFLECMLVEYGLAPLISSCGATGHWAAADSDMGTIKENMDDDY